MTAPEICYLLATAAFVLEALPSFKSKTNLLSLGLALLAFGLALSAGLDHDLGIEGHIVNLSLR